MKLELKPFDFAQAVARAGLRPDGHPVGKAAPAALEPADKASFTSAMAEALRAVSDAQMEATDMQQAFSMDDPTVSLEKTMVAMNKSQIGFTAALTVRNRMVQAYTDIMNMQV
jgi:flagellar hook-basal body complex protein FliE